VNLRLGFFPQFKGADSILLAGEADDIARLSGALVSFVASSQDQLSIHGLAAVSALHPAKLYATHSTEPSGSDFRWLCSPATQSTIQGKLAALAMSGKGHQYFSLIGSPVQLVVSVGEHPPSWWGAHA
jgi:hypothetical protein